jgi:hypothetical protein
MIQLGTIISTFSKDEQQQFILYLEKKNKRHDTKNIQLFKLIAAEDLNSNALCNRLYPAKSKDAYHALRKRLYNSIIDFIASKNLEDESSENMQIIKYILVARAFLKQRHYETAYKLLDKAESIAQELQLYIYLNEIYHTKIQFAHLNPKTELDTLITTFKDNQKLYFIEEELNMVYAKIREALHKMTFKSEVIDFQSLLETTLKAHNISIHDSLSLKSFYKLLTIASISAFVTKDYLQIESFVTRTYTTIKARTTKELNTFYHIEVLYLVANTFFRNKKFEQSLEYLELMHQEMQKQQRKYYKRFKLKYVLVKALNLNYANQQSEAIALIEPLLHKKHDDLEALLDIHLSAIVFYTQQPDYKKAFSLLSKFYHTDKWYIDKVGTEWVIKKNLVELLLNLELGNLEVFESRLLSFKRQYTSYLKDIGQERVLGFLKFVEAYYLHPERVTSKSFFDTVEHSFVWVEAQREDIFVMSFYAWLKSKMEQKPLFEVTLQLVERARKTG